MLHSDFRFLSTAILFVSDNFYYVIFVKVHSKKPVCNHVIYPHITNVPTEGFNNKRNHEKGSTSIIYDELPFYISISNFSIQDHNT